VRDDDPVIVFEDTKLWSSKGPVPVDPDYLVPIGRAAVSKLGTDVTLIGIAGAIRPTLQAAQDLAAMGISAEVLDLRTLKPLDTESILVSVRKTGRLVLIENAHRMANASAEIAALVAEEAFTSLRAPIVRLSAPDVQVPFSPALEALMYPKREQIVAAAQRVCT
jgi:pyruvate dehydrogenase E1 component beta subunit